MRRVGELLRKKYNQEDRKAFPFCYVMVGIPFLFFLVFWVYVNFSSVVIAFQDDFGKFTFQNFSDVFNAFADKDMYGWNLGAVLWRTVRLWFYVNLLCVLPSLFSTYVLYKKIPGHYVFRVIFMIPTVLAGIVWAMIMKNMVSVGGPILLLAEAFGIEIPYEISVTGSLLASSQTAYITIVIINLIPHIIGFNMIISGAYARIPQELFEVGKLEGVNFVREFFAVSMPMVWPTIVVAMISNLSTIFTLEGNVFLYTMGNYETGTMGFYIYYLTYRIAGNADTGFVSYGYPAAIGLTITCFTIPVVLFGKYVLEKMVETVEY